MRIRCLLIALLLQVFSISGFAQVSGTAALDNTKINGMRNGMMKLYSPNPVQVGSSVSHWDTSATPNLLMEPSINSDLPFKGLDITPGQMQDVFWPIGTSTFVITDLGAPGTGFTDPRPFTPVGGNTATTLGEARLNLINSVLDVWGTTLNSTVPIDVLVAWTPLFCDPNAGAVLAAAGSLSVIALEGGGLPGPTWFHAALAESLIGAEITDPPATGGGDIIVIVNSDLDEECLGAGTGYYYGLDGNVPSNNIDLSAVTLHELAHGLGFSNFTNESTGELFFDQASIFDLFTLDIETGKTWDEMTNQERVDSSVRDGGLLWTGANANAAGAAQLTPGVPSLNVAAPPSVADNYELSQAASSPPLTTTGVTGPLSCAEYNGCSPSTSMVAGDILLAPRGNCSFLTKATNAEAAGASAVIVVNYDDALISLGGDFSAIGIPVLGMRSSDGDPLIAEACDPATDVSVTSYIEEPGPHFVGQEVNYFINATNNGPAEATSVLITDLPSNMTMTGLVSEFCSTLPCTIDSLGSGEGAIVHVMATLGSVGAFSSTSEAFAAEPDLESSNNTASFSGTVLDLSADLSVSLTLDSSFPYIERRDVNYTLTVANAGKDIATNVVVSGTLTNLELKSISSAAVPATAAAGLRAPSTVSLCTSLPCNLGSIGVGESVVLDITATVLEAAAFELAASVSAYEPDPDPSNNDTGPGIGGSAVDTLTAIPALGVGYLAGLILLMLGLGVYYRRDRGFPIRGRKT